MAEDAFDWSNDLNHVASSDVGMRRANNQDACAISLAADEDEWFERGHLFVVADGMGAHAAGELASKLAVDHVVHIYRKNNQLSPPEALEKAIREANDEIHRRGEANLDFHNMGTTCSSLLLLPQGAIAGHVGDSRIYRLRGSKLEQLTFDHSLVWEMREAGQIAGDGEDSQVPKNVITRSLGPQPTVKVDLEGPFPVHLGDKYLLCSDGLTGRVTDAEIGAALAVLPVDQASTLLINLANLRGGPDNITIVSADVVGELLTSVTSGAAPLTIGGQVGPRPPLHPAWWVGLGVSGLLAAALVVAKSWVWGIVPAVVFVCLVIAIGVQLSDLLGAAGVRLAGGRRLGKGPHRTFKVVAAQEFFDTVIEMLRTGSETAKQKGWHADWTEFDGQIEFASKRKASGQAGAAFEQLVIASSFSCPTVSSPDARTVIRLQSTERAFPARRRMPVLRPNRVRRSSP